MAFPLHQDVAPPLGTRQALAAFAAARERTLSLIGGLGERELEAVYSPLMSPLVWDLGHIAAYEDLWLVHRHAGLPLLRPDLAEVYDAFETPRAVRGDIEILATRAALEYLERVRARTIDAVDRHGVGDGVVHEMVLRHELQHGETMLQALGLARLSVHRPAGMATAPPAPGGHSGLETVAVPAGPFELGAPADRFSYDNERSRHRVEVGQFRIGRTPVTNATWLTFAEGGGYERREWWSREAWAWKEDQDIHRPGGWILGLEGDAPQLHGRPVFEWRVGGAEPLDLDKPVVHISWFEAEAFARAHGVRLPSEEEWEKAATWDQRTGETLSEAGPGADTANLGESGTFGTAPVGAYPRGAAPCGALGMIGDVWEWTATPFGGYPGFVAFPYREYSQVFFGEAYRVLRGGSWATSARVATPTFRNWDLPERRQIFAGLRIATDGYPDGHR